MNEELLSLIKSPKIQKRWQLAEQDRVFLKVREDYEDWFVRLLEKQAVFLSTEEDDKFVISRRQLLEEAIWLCSEKQIANFVKEQNEITDDEFKRQFQVYLDANGKQSNYESVVRFCLQELNEI
ncbi:MAG: hypothetical protein DWQ06_08450 [Calditrichaeota bacterium]|nr:MAG: hypothetical protein DWQ06_08450 [Calditrichota bacterium]